MSYFHSLKVKELKKEAVDALIITFEIPEALKEQFIFLPGQHLTLKTDIDGTEIRRSYSICAAPHENIIKVAVKKMEGGVFSNYALNTLKKGHALDVMAPLGRFTPKLDSKSAKNYLLIAAGSGITPVISILKTILYTEPNSNITLIYGNRNTKSVMFKEELEDLKNRFLNRLTLYFVLSREKVDAPILNGRIDREKCQRFFTKLLPVKDFNAAYICGPEGMVLAAKEELIAQGMPENQVHLELFTTPGQVFGAALDNSVHTVNYDASSESMVTLKLNGKTYEFPLKYSGVNILDAALEEGVDLPFACKGGVCCTCRAKLASGKVDMTVNYGLEPDELEAGFILTCQSHPRTDKITVDFDIK